MEGMVTLVNSNIEELYMRCQEINYIGCICCSIIRFIYSTGALNIAQWVRAGVTEKSSGKEYLIIPQNREITPGLLQFTFIIRKPFHVNFVSPSFYSQLEVCKIILFLAFANCSPSHLPYWQTGPVSLQGKTNIRRKERVNLAFHFYGLNKI